MMSKPLSLRLGVALRALALISLVSLTLGDARSEPLVVSGTRYASRTDFLYGTWEWLRQQPAQKIQLRFSRDGTFFFNNFTTGLTHQGRFDADKTEAMHLTITKSCDKEGCNNRNPPLIVEYPMRPSAANIFYSADEKWDRLSRE
jgi:hypothetical protein